jgi:hypothetical protein
MARLPRLSVEPGLRSLRRLGFLARDLVSFAPALEQALLMRLLEVDRAAPVGVELVGLAALFGKLVRGLPVARDSRLLLAQAGAKPTQPRGEPLNDRPERHRILPGLCGLVRLLVGRLGPNLPPGSDVHIAVHVV